MIDTLRAVIDQQIDTTCISDTVKVALLSPEQDFCTWISNPNTMIAVTAIIISLVGLLLSARHNRRTFKLTKKHNELSTKPLLHYSASIDSQTGILKLVISNRGLGPAIIKSLVYKFDSIKKNNITEVFKSIKEQLKFPTQSNLEVKDKELTENAILSPGDFFDIFTIKIEPPKYTDMIAQILDKVKIEIIFQDIYGNEFDNI